MCMGNPLCICDNNYLKLHCTPTLSPIIKRDDYKFVDLKCNHCLKTWAGDLELIFPLILKHECNKIVDKIISDISSRSGLSDAWHSIDKNTREEIKNEWIELINEEE